MEKLYIIDGHNILFRSYYAIRGMTNPKGQSTNAVYGFIRTVYKLIDDFDASHLVTVFDGPNNIESRLEIYDEYKSHRTAMPEDLRPQIGWAQEFCEMAGIPLLVLEGVEADDTMGSVATWAAKHGADAYLCSSDKDLCQLVDAKIRMIQLHKNNLIVDKAKVEELYGIEPKQMIDYLAIVGDASDNIPGLSGFGPKTASMLLQEHGSLDEILAHPEKVKGAKKQETLVNEKEIALMSRALATIKTDVKIPTSETFYSLKEPDLSNVKRFYIEMHFMSLLKVLGEGSESTGAPTVKEKAQPIHKEYSLIKDLEALEALQAELSKYKEICLDTETTDIRPMHAQLVGVGLGVEPGKAWYIPCNGPLAKERVLAFLDALFAQPHVAFIGHNIKYDLHVMANEGLPVPRVSFDTMIASYILHPEKQRHNLDLLTLETFGFNKTPIDTLIGKGKKQISMAEAPVQQVSDYCCEDVDYTLRLKERFEGELKEEKLDDLFRTIEVPLLPVLFKMERAGIYLDESKLSQMGVEVGQNIAHLEKEIYALAGKKFNLNSPKQLSEILFTNLGIKPPKKTQTGFSTAAAVLEALKDQHPIVEMIIDYRGLAKLLSTYIEALPTQIFPKTGRIHCTFNQSVAATGRLSCQDPNLQNIPIRSQEGKKIRAAFNPQKKESSFLSLDYSQIELRLLAHLSQDPTLIKAFQAGEDIHATTAALIFDVPLTQVTKPMRHKAKAVNFGILYGQGAFGLSQGLQIDYKEAAHFIDTYFKRFAKVQAYLESCKTSARKLGYAMTMLGRKRPIPDINTKNPQLRAAAERLAINTPLQGTAADLIKMAMIEVDALLTKHPTWGTLLLQIHDELIFVAPNETIQDLSTHVKKIMEGVLKLEVPLTVDISIGKNWEEC